MKPKKEMIRIVKSPENEIKLDRVGKAPGRGAYICPVPECLTKAMKTKVLEKSLDQKISDEIYRQLEEELANREL